MSAEDLHALTAAVSGPQLMRHLGEFARWTKLSGTPDERRNLDYVQQELRGYGFATTILLHDAYISLPVRSRVEIDGTTPRSITHSFSRSSPSGGLGADVIYVGGGTETDFAGNDVRGRIALVEGIANPAVADRARRAGAAGQLHISPHEHIHEMCISPVWGSPAPTTLSDMPATVVASIAEADGAALRDRLSRGERPRVTLHAEVDTGWRRTPILVADLASTGSGDDEPFVLFSGHHDTWYYGVMDNGGANATMLEVARLCAAKRGSWRRGLRLCFWSGHSHGRYSGSTWYADEYWEELERRCVAHVNIDSTGGIGASVLSNAAAMAELAPLAAEAIREQAGSDYLGRPMDRSSDQSFWGIGLPSMLGSLSEQPPGPVNVRTKLGWWWHTPEDTLDKIDEGNLVRDTRVFVHVLWRFLSDARLPIDYAAWITGLETQLEGVAVELRERLPLDGVISALRTLAGKVRDLDQLEPACANAMLMRLSRILVPLHTRSGERFVHDPALPQPSLPDLQALRDLAEARPGTDSAHFNAVAARRARNRLRHVLHEACRVLTV